MNVYPEFAMHDDAVTALAGWYQRWRDERREQPAALRGMLDRLSAHAHARLTMHELGLCHKCKVHCDRSRRLTEAGEEGEACRALAVARAVAESESLSEEARWLCQAEIAPAEAHNEQIAGNWALARLQVQRSLNLDARLESELGYTEKIAHRVHMLSVQITLLGGERLLAEAGCLAASCLNLLDGESIEMPVARDWSPASLHVLPAGMTGILATHVSTALIGILVGLRSTDREILVGQFIRNCSADRVRKLVSQPIAGSRFRVDTLDATQLCAWLVLSLKASTGQTAFLEATRRCLRRSRGTALFHLLAFDAACVLRESGEGPQQAMLLAQAVAHHVNAKPWWRLLGNSWRTRLKYQQIPLRGPLLYTEPAYSRNLAVQV